MDATDQKCQLRPYIRLSHILSNIYLFFRPKIGDLVKTIFINLIVVVEATRN